MPEDSDAHGIDRLLKARRGPLSIAAGFGLLIAGVILLVLPGPGTLLILLGLALLARHFRWARRLQTRAVALADRGVGSVRAMLGRLRAHPQSDQ